MFSAVEESTAWWALITAGRINPRNGPEVTIPRVTTTRIGRNAVRSGFCAMMTSVIRSAMNSPTRGSSRLASTRSAKVSSRSRILPTYSISRLTATTTMPVPPSSSDNGRDPLRAFGGFVIWSFWGGELGEGLNLHGACG